MEGHSKKQPQPQISSMQSSKYTQMDNISSPPPHSFKNRSLRLLMTVPDVYEYSSSLPSLQTIIPPSSSKNIFSNSGSPPANAFQLAMVEKLSDRVNLKNSFKQHHLNSKQQQQQQSSSSHTHIHSIGQPSHPPHNLLESSKVPSHQPPPLDDRN